jgi:hypothetical protein
MNIVKTIERDLVEAYELRTGFVGIGKFFEEKGLLRIIGGEPCEK